MKFKFNHGHYVGQIIRDGKHFREVLIALGPLYSTRPYKVNGPLFPPKPDTQDNDTVLRIINNQIHKDDLTFR